VPNVPGMALHTGVHTLVRRTHEERVLDALRESGALSRSEIARRVGLSRTTLSEITADLLARGVIAVVDTDAAHRVGSGRPAERLALDPSSGQFLGVDLGHREVHVAVADASREVIATAVERFPDGTPWEERVRGTLTLVDRTAAEHGVHFNALQAVGVGVPGPYRAGVAHPGPAPAVDAPITARWWGTRQVADRIEDAFGAHFAAPVVIDNNTRFAALAEALHAQPRTRELLYVRLGDGVGGGVVTEGRLVTGAAGLAGEVGHVRAVPAGRLCRCGKHGCLETVASAPAVLAECRRRGVAVATLEDLADRVAIEHPVVNEVLHDAATALGAALAAIAMVVNPAEIVIAGRIATLAPRIVEQAAATARFELFSLADAAPVVRAARLPANAGALGALTAVVQLTGADRIPTPNVRVQRSIP